MDREGLAWAAGFFDGEGTFGAWHRRDRNRLTLRATINQAHAEVLYKFGATVGVGSVYGPRPQRGLGTKPMWEWRANSFEAAQHVIAVLWPWLGSVKREQAVRAMKGVGRTQTKPASRGGQADRPTTHWRCQMKRAIAIALTTGLLLGALVATAGPASANKECRYGTGRRAMRQTVVCVASKFGDVSRSHALYVADRESNFQAHARNPYSGTCGIYQHMPSYWPSRYRSSSPPRWGRMPSNCFNGRTNIIVSLTMVHRTGWGPWGG